MHLEKPCYISKLLVVFAVFNVSCLVLASLQEEMATISIAVPSCQDLEEGIVGKMPESFRMLARIEYEKLRWCCRKADFTQ